MSHQQHDKSSKSAGPDRTSHDGDGMFHSHQENASAWSAFPLPSSPSSVDDFYIEYRIGKPRNEANEESENSVRQEPNMHVIRMFAGYLVGEVVGMTCTFLSSAERAA